MKKNYCSACGAYEHLDSFGKYCKRCKAVYDRAYKAAKRRIKKEQERECGEERTTINERPTEHSPHDQERDC